MPHSESQSSKFRHVSHSKFRIVSLSTVLELLSTGQFFAALDLKDVYLNILIHRDHLISLVPSR